MFKSMKKIFSIALIACMAISVSAQQQVERMKLNAKKVVEKSMFQTLPERSMDVTTYQNGQLPAKITPRRVANAAKQDTAFYFVDADKSLYGGMTNDGYTPWPTIFQMCSSDVTFYNASEFNENSQFGWFIGEVASDNMLSADTNMVVPASTFDPGYGYSVTPIFAMESGKQYAYGSTEAKQYWYGFDNEEYWPMTKCHMYTSTVYDEDGNDFVQWMWNEDMPYIYGTGFDLSMYPKYGLDLIDTIGTPWGFDDCITGIDSINIMIMTRGATSLQIGDRLKLALHPVTVTETGVLVDLDTEIASHIAAAKDITYEYGFDQYNVALGVVTFPIKAEIEGQFFITVSGFNGTGANFGLYSDGADPYGYGDTYFIDNDNFVDLFGMNACISVNAIIIEGAQGDAINNVNVETVKPVKEIRNGQVIIKRGSQSFNILGTEIR